MDDNARDELITSMMEMSITLAPMRDFIAGEKERFIASGFSEETSEKMCESTWKYILEMLIHEVRKEGN